MKQFKNYKVVREEESIIEFERILTGDSYTFNKNTGECLHACHNSRNYKSARYLKGFSFIYEMYLEEKAKFEEEDNSVLGKSVVCVLNSFGRETHIVGECTVDCEAHFTLERVTITRSNGKVEHWPKYSIPKVYLRGEGCYWRINE